MMKSAPTFVFTVALLQGACTFEVAASGTGLFARASTPSAGGTSVAPAVAGHATVATSLAARDSHSMRTNVDTLAPQTVGQVGVGVVATVAGVTLTGRAHGGDPFQVAVRGGRIELSGIGELSGATITDGSLMVSAPSERDARTITGARSQSVAGTTARPVAGATAMTPGVPARWAVLGGRVVLASGEVRVVREGVLTLLRDDAGQWRVTEGRVALGSDLVVPPAPETLTAGGSAAETAERVLPPANTPSATVGASPLLTSSSATAMAPSASATASSAAVQRIALRGRSGVVIGGEIQVVGGVTGSVGDGFTVLDGDVDLTDGVSRDGSGDIGAGTVLLASAGGRRYRARVEGGRVVLRAAGRGTSGQALFTALRGEIHVTVVATGDARLALRDDGASSASARIAVGGDPSVPALAGRPAVLSARTLASLDLLVSLQPAGSREAMRQAAAVEAVIARARSAAPDVYDTPIVGRTVVLLVDLSYSMSETDTTIATGALGGSNRVATKLDVARAELVKMLSALAVGTRVNIVGFSSDHHALWAAPRAIGDATLREAVRWVAALRPLDETEPVPALAAALEMQADQVVLISDGRPTHATPSEVAMLDLATRLGAHGGRLDTVGIGADQDAGFLATLTARGHGSTRRW